MAKTIDEEKQDFDAKVASKKALEQEIKTLVGSKPKTVDELTIIVEKILILLGVS